MPDWITLSKFLPQLVYPFNLALLLLLAALLLIFFGRRRSGVFTVFLAFVILVVCASPLSLVLYRQHELRHTPVPISSSPTADVIVLLGGDVGLPVRQSQPNVDVWIVGLEGGDQRREQFLA